MPWTYEIATGKMLAPDGSLAAMGYSGQPPYRNDPASQSVRDEGPIPEGLYYMLQPVDSDEHGPFAIPLRPDPSNQMYGRSGFLCHGDSIVHPGLASKGCIIMPFFARNAMWESQDRMIIVVKRDSGIAELGGTNG